MRDLGGGTGRRGRIFGESETRRRRSEAFGSAKLFRVGNALGWVDLLLGKTLGVASARVCRAAEQERERAEFFCQRLGRCATWREGSLVTRSVPPLLLRGRVLQVQPRHLGLPKFPRISLPPPPFLSLSNKIKQRLSIVVVGGLQNIYFFAERTLHF